MKQILAPRQRGVLRKLAEVDSVMAFDYDGTLAPITSDFSRASMRPRTGRLFRSLCLSYPCAIITGRKRSNLLQQIPPFRLCYVAGNHGLEWEPPLEGLERYKPILLAWAEALRKDLKLPNVVVENKGYSLSIHYRHAKDRRATQGAVCEAARRLKGAYLIPGKQALNVLPVKDLNKATALEKIKKNLRVQAALYIGDDRTDEIVFAKFKNSNLVTIRVGRSARSQAKYYVKNQKEVDTLLKVLLRFRG